MKFEVRNEDQLRIFLDYAKRKQYFMAFELALSIGMRQSEILALRRMDVHLANETVSVRKAYTLAEVGHDFDDTKNDFNTRSIALFESTVRFLKEHFDTSSRIIAEKPTLLN
ncbi:hypothetical protein NYE70_23555 [Paenibacillus sp. FSL R5-0407]|uniref:hypothetical protein n=1 Tax=Paenibacillus sp. FSL R5-0407 TaxID=2975320 RepID=UPI0030F62CAC